MKTPLLAVLLLTLAGAARAQSFAEAKKKAGDMKSAEGKAIGGPLGRTANASKYSQTALKHSVEWLTTGEVPQKAVDFINSKGCALGFDGKLVALNVNAWNVAVKETAARTEVVYFTSQEMRRMSGNPMAVAIGLNAEMKKTYESAANVTIGTPGKHALGLRRGQAADGRAEVPGPKDEAPDSGIAALQAAHELLHIVLRQFGNENLGGGSRKGSPDKDVANAHHQFICSFGQGWCQFMQSDKLWDGKTSQDCAANAQQGQADNAAFLKSVEPKP